MSANSISHINGEEECMSSSEQKKTNFQSLPERTSHEQFLRKSLDLILDRVVFAGTERGGKVVEWASPETIRDAIDLKPKFQPVSQEQLLKFIEKISRYSVHTGHPYFVNQLFSSLDPYGLVGQWLTDALNLGLCTYEMAPVFTLMEEEVLFEMRRIIGWEDGDGIFAPGGSIANGYGISCARYYFNPEIKNKGISSAPRLVLFASEWAHYSSKKLASFMGIGGDNCIAVKTDPVGRMDPQDLDAKIQTAINDGATPFLVMATSGTTVFGAFDPIILISDICKKYKLWLHVDAALGGGVLVSKKYRDLMEGVERADSVTWNPHKLLTAPQQCSTFLLRHKNVLFECHSSNAKYLFQKDKFYDTTYDTGDKHIQSGHRADVLKFWFMWKAKGTDGLEKHIDKLFDNTEFFLDYIKNREGFEIVISQPQCTSVCFWYIPPSLRGKKSQGDYDELLNKVAPKIKERMVKEGTMMISYQPQGTLPNFFRIVFQNSGLDHSDMIFFAKEIERLGCDL